MINWIKHKIKVHEYKGVFRELEILGNRLQELRNVYQSEAWTTRGLSQSSKIKIEEEYAKFGKKYAEYTTLTISSGLGDETEKVHLKIFNSQYMPNDITRTLEEDLEWDK
jgi:hypothetical protein